MRALRARTAAATLSGTPGTGPIVPSGLIVPVIVMSGSSSSPRSSAITATVNSAPTF